MAKELNDRELFDRVALSHEHFDDEWIEDVQDKIRDHVVGRQEWDSGGPGAGAGTVNVYQFRGIFISENDVDMYGPFDSFADAAAAVGLFTETSATTRIWVDLHFKEEQPKPRKRRGQRKPRSKAHRPV
jgi:hypothetical protein